MIKEIEIQNTNKETPNILCFYDESFQRYSSTNFIHCFLKNKLELKVPENITYITIGNKNETFLSNQLNKTSRILIDPISQDTLVDEKILNEYEHKILFEIINKLNHISTEYTIISNEANTIIQNFSNILEKFNNTKLDILFSASKDNKPNIVVDIINNRDWRGDFRYFCGYCCIGKTKSLLQFFTDCNNFNNIDNIFNYQYVARNVFQKYIQSKEILIDFDYQCNIIQNFQRTMLKDISSITKKIYVVL